MQIIYQPTNALRIIAEPAEQERMFRLEYFSGRNTRANVVVYGNGQILKEKRSHISKGTNSIILDLTNVPAGEHEIAIITLEEISSIRVQLT